MTPVSGTPSVSAFLHERLAAYIVAAPERVFAISIARVAGHIRRH